MEFDGKVGGVSSIPLPKEGESYCLKWHTFQSHFTKGLKTLFLENDAGDTDVILGTEGRHIRAHRWLLSLCSPYFKRLFNASPNKQANHVVILNQFKFGDLNNLVYFMYNGEVSIATRKDLHGFLKIGELLEVEGLCRSHSVAESESIPVQRAPVSVPSTSGNESLANTSAGYPSASSNASGSNVIGHEECIAECPSHSQSSSIPIFPSTSGFFQPIRRTPLSTSYPAAKRPRMFPENQQHQSEIHTENVLRSNSIDTVTIDEDVGSLEYPEDMNVPLKDPLAFDSSLLTEETSECDETENIEADETMIDIQEPIMKGEIVYVHDEDTEGVSDDGDNEYNFGSQETIGEKKDIRQRNDLKGELAGVQNNVEAGLKNGKLECGRSGLPSKIIKSPDDVKTPAVAITNRFEGEHQFIDSTTVRTYFRYSAVENISECVICDSRFTGNHANNLRKHLVGKHKSYFNLSDSHSRIS